MTLSQLRDSVALLGFEQSVANIDDNAEEAFLWAASRAVSFVNSLRPVTDSFVLSVTDNEVAIDGLTVTPSQMGEVMQFYKFVLVDKPIQRYRTPIMENGFYLDGSMFRVQNQYYMGQNQKVLLLHKSFRGSLLVEYEKQTPIFTQAMLGDELPLDNELCLILDCLVAYYILIEDDPQKAADYKAKFNENFQRIDVQSRKTHTDNYYSTNNW